MDRIYQTFSESDIRAFEAPMKVGLLATVNDAGLPHLTLISTLQAASPMQLIWGQFTEGLSKAFVRRNPKTGFLIMTLDRTLWRGKADWTHIAKSGAAYEMYNNTPMFRYNAYFGVHSVHYMDLLAHYGRESLPMAQIVRAAVSTRVAKALWKAPAAKKVLNRWTRGLLDGMSNLKFLAYVDAEGYPEIIPVIQALTADREHVVFASSVYGPELRAIPDGATVAFFGMSLDMEDVLLRGVYHGVRPIGGIRCGLLQVNWVYNSMPPKPQQIYPELEVTPVTKF
jgi:hypothetical protein